MRRRSASPVRGGESCSDWHRPRGEVEDTLDDLDAVDAVDQLLRDAPTLRALAAPSRTERVRSVSPRDRLRNSSPPEQAFRGAVAGKELLRSLIEDAAELSDVEQWLGSAADGAFEPIEPPWSTGGEGKCDSVNHVAPVAVKSARCAKRLNKATRAEKQKEFAARGSAAGMALLQSMLERHSMSTGHTSNWSEGEGDTQAVLFEVEPPEPAHAAVPRCPVRLLQNSIYAPVQRTALMLLGSRGAVAAQRRQLQCRRSPAVICGPIESDSIHIGISMGHDWACARPDIRLDEARPWEPPDLFEWEHDDGSAENPDAGRLVCRDQRPGYCSDAKLSTSAKATQMTCSQQLDNFNAAEAPNDAHGEQAGDEEHDEHNPSKRSPIPLQRKRRRSPVARGGVGIAAGGTAPSTALSRRGASASVFYDSQQQPGPNITAPTRMPVAPPAAVAMDTAVVPMLPVATVRGCSSSSSDHEDDQEPPMEMEVQEEEPCSYVHAYLSQALDALIAEDDNEPQVACGTQEREVAQGQGQENQHIVPAALTAHEQVVMSDLDIALESEQVLGSKEKHGFALDEHVPTVEADATSNTEVLTHRTVETWSCFLDSDSDSDQEQVVGVATATTTAHHQQRVPLQRVEEQLNRVSESAAKERKDSGSKGQTMKREQDKRPIADVDAGSTSISIDASPACKLQPHRSAAPIVRGVGAESDAAGSDSDSDSDFDNSNLHTGRRNIRAGRDLGGESGQTTEKTRATDTETLTRPTVLGLGATGSRWVPKDEVLRATKAAERKSNRNTAWAKSVVVRLLWLDMHLLQWPECVTFFSSSASVYCFGFQVHRGGLVAGRGGDGDELRSYATHQSFKSSSCQGPRCDRSRRGAHHRWSVVQDPSMQHHK